MVTTDRFQQLDQLLDTAIASFDIPDELYERAVARYKHVGAWLDGHWAESRSDGAVYPQGSFRLGTVVQPINPDDDYDIDLVCRRDIAKESTTHEELKKDVGDGLRLYVVTRPVGSPRRSEGKRCWTLDYQAEPFHMDVLPALPDLGAAANAILLTDRDLRRWQHSNPIDYASWFHETMKREFIRLREARAMVARMDVDEVPDWTVKKTLQRTVQALKRHRDFYFAESPDDRPASIIITTLAAKAYTGDGTLYEVLVDVTQKMPRLVEQRDGVYWVENPVQRKENFADRWSKHPEGARHFFEWIARAQSDLSEVGSEPGVDRVLQGIARSWGDAAAKHTGKVFGSHLAQARDGGRLGMGAGTGLLGAAGSKSIPRHTFHGDEPSDHDS